MSTDIQSGNHLEIAKELPNQVTPHIIYLIVSGVLNTIGASAAADTEYNQRLHVMKTGIMRDKAQVKHESAGVK